MKDEKIDILEITVRQLKGRIRLHHYFRMIVSLLVINLLLFSYYYFDDFNRTLESKSLVYSVFGFIAIISLIVEMLRFLSSLKLYRNIVQLLDKAKFYNNSRKISGSQYDQVNEIINKINMH